MNKNGEITLKTKYPVVEYLLAERVGIPHRRLADTRMEKLRAGTDWTKSDGVVLLSLKGRDKLLKEMGIDPEDGEQESLASELPGGEKSGGSIGPALPGEGEQGGEEQADKAELIGESDPAKISIDLAVAPVKVKMLVTKVFKFKNYVQAIDECGITHTVRVRDNTNFVRCNPRTKEGMSFVVLVHQGLCFYNGKLPRRKGRW